ncbi:hypothetical protein HMPREF2086_01553 [Helicobacter macacae MIT 99-5501]|uniref:Lipoprotein n=1 Tax=Helicobacter macacae MIT 99-5501 TaxID=1357400 RepID=V8C5W0_9HELI|nr:hypothetical protein HMPREF2086_01553 [Helicobacter macacae MIT 99-5501]
MIKILGANVRGFALVLSMVVLGGVVSGCASEGTIAVKQKHIKTHSKHYKHHKHHKHHRR